MRKYNDPSVRKRMPLKRWAGPQQNGDAHAKRAGSDERYNAKHLQHFTRCELSRPLKDQESRGHVFTKANLHPFDQVKAKRGRVQIRCVFCGELDTLTRLHPNVNADHKLVENVLGNDFVKAEEKARDIELMFYDQGQEVFEN